MSSKGPRSPQILKTSLMSSSSKSLKFRSSVGPQILKRCQVLKILESHQKQLKVHIRCTVPRKVLKRSSKRSSKCPHDLRCSNESTWKGPQRFLNVLKGSTKSSYPQNVIKVLKTSSKCSQIPQVLSRSSDPRNVVNVPKVLESPQKQLKVHRFSGPQFPGKSWKDPQKVLKRYSKCPQKVLKVLKMFWKSSKCPQSTQFLK